MIGNCCWFLQQETSASHHRVYVFPIFKKYSEQYNCLAFVLPESGLPSHMIDMSSRLPYHVTDISISSLVTCMLTFYCAWACLIQLSRNKLQYSHLWSLSETILSGQLGLGMLQSDMWQFLVFMYMYFELFWWITNFFMKWYLPQKRREKTVWASFLWLMTLHLQVKIKCKWKHVPSRCTKLLTAFR